VSTSQPTARSENVLGGFLLALLAIPVGVVVLALLSSIGFIASIVGFLVAFSAVWLYRRGSGGFISRTGAWIITAIVLVTLLLGIWVDLVITFAHGLGHLNNIGLDGFWPQFNDDLPANLSNNVLFIVLILAFGALGAFRTIGRAFAVARATSRPVGTPTGSASSAASPTSTTTAYKNDVDAPPTGSADDRTAPPSAGG
jgi:hypothetical protein